MIEVNYLAVLVAALAGMVFGFIWYGPLFGKVWVKLMGFSQQDMNKMKEKGMAKTYFWAFVMAVVMAYVLAHFAVAWDVINAMDVFQLAFWIWLGFVVTIQLNSVLWSGKPFQLYLLDIFHYLFAIYIMALVLNYWR